MNGGSSLFALNRNCHTYTSVVPTALVADNLQSMMFRLVVCKLFVHV